MDSTNDSLILNIFKSETKSIKKSNKTLKNGNNYNRKHQQNGSQQEIDHKLDELNDRNEDSEQSMTRKRNINRNKSKPFSGERREKFFSSLFQNNPEIPRISLKEENSRTEEVFSSHNYEELRLHPFLISCLRDRFSITETTSVQQKSIPLLMSGNDALIKSITGSGKTLAFAIPVIQSLQSIEPKITRSDGILALVIVPTRELAIQCFECFSVLTQAFKRIVAGYLIGGEKKKSEKARIRKGINVLITTPGRLLDHIGSTHNLHLNKVKWFVIDEADRLLEQGFEESAAKIVEHLRNVCEWKPQTVLLSATLTEGVQRLAGMSLVDPNIIDMSDQNMTIDSFVLPQNLSQHYIIVPAKLRLITLSSFIIDKSSVGNFKALIFMSCQDVVDFYYTIFNNILNRLLKKSDIEEVGFFQLHGNMQQSDRVQVFHRFRECKVGVLICTDVAARGLDLPKVDWIIQFSCAPKTEDYVHRVGRTARIGNYGNAIQFLLTSETTFLEALQKDLRINLYEMDFKECLKSIMLLKFNRKIHNNEEYATHLQSIYENDISSDTDLNDLAKRAYLSYLRSYASYPKSMSETLPFKDLHLGHLAKSFGLQESPKALGAYGFRLKQQSIDLQQKYNNYNKKIKFSHFNDSNNDNNNNNNNNEPNKRRKVSQMPSEMKVSEFGGQLITKLPTNKKSKKRTHYF